jgi:hypothetical protein
MKAGAYNIFSFKPISLPHLVNPSIVISGNFKADEGDHGKLIT